MAYFLIGALLALTGGLSNALLVANLPLVQAQGDELVARVALHQALGGGAGVTP